MRRTMLWAGVALLVELFHAPVTLAEVVADSACPKYAVDIAYFATCEGDRVAKAAPPQTAATAPTTAKAGEPPLVNHASRELQNRNQTATARSRRQLAGENTPVRATR